MATAKKLKHPAAGKQMRGADMVIQVMADEGVDTIFGYSGGAILPTYDGVFQWNEQHPKQKINRKKIELPKSKWNKNCRSSSSQNLNKCRPK